MGEQGKGQRGNSGNGKMGKWETEHLETLGPFLCSRRFPFALFPRSASSPSPVASVGDLRRIHNSVHRILVFRKTAPATREH